MNNNVRIIINNDMFSGLLPDWKFADCVASAVD